MPTTEVALQILELFRNSGVFIDNHTREYLRAIMYRTQAYTQIDMIQRQWMQDNRIVT
jgi:hypothetical protein